MYLIRNPKLTYMSLKNCIFRCFVMVSALLFVACVDESYDLANVSGEVTIGHGETILKVGELKRKSVKDLIKDKEIEGIVQDENGNYTFSKSGGDTIIIEDITKRFEVPEVFNTFSVEYPDFKIDMTPIVLNESKSIDVGLDVLEDYKELPDLPGVDVSELGDTFYLPDGELLPVIEGSVTHTFDPEDIEFDVPDMIKGFKKLIFRDIDGEHRGAPMLLKVQFNDFADIIKEGELKFNLDVTGGTFVILDQYGNPIYEGSNYENRYKVAEGAKELYITLYVESLTSVNHVENHHIDIPLALDFSMDFSITPKSGLFSLNNKPTVTLMANFEYGDAEVELDPEVKLVDFEPDSQQARSINIVDLPEQVKGLERVDLVEGQSLRLRARGLEWLDSKVADYIVIEATLPKFLDLKELSDADYTYDAQEHKIIASIDALSDGVDVVLEALDFGDGIAPVDGEIKLEFKPHITARFRDGVSVAVSSLEHSGNVDIEVGIEKMNLLVLAIAGRVDYDYKIEKSIEIEKLDILKNLEIEGIGLSPMVVINIKNPLTLPLKVNGSISDGVDSSLSIEGVEIDAAGYDGSDIVVVERKIVLADKKPNYECIFVPLNINELVDGSIPSKIDVNLNIGVDSNVSNTLYIDDDFRILYDYSLELPVAFNNELNINYQYDIENLDDLFDDLKEYDIKVGDVTIIAEVMNTLPIGINASVELRDKEGNATSAQLEGESASGAEFVIAGSVDGVTPEYTKAELDLIVDGGRIAELAKVSKIHLDLQAMGEAAEGKEVSILDEQYIEAVFSVRLSKGITVDVKDFLE